MDQKTSSISSKLSLLRQALEREDSGVRSLIAECDGRVVMEYYRGDITPGALEGVNSVTKSVVGLAAGIALREGLLPALDTRIHTLLPEARDPSLDPRVRSITLRHLLTMTSGFEWDPQVIDDCVLGACERFTGDEDRLRFILSRPFAHAPGARFVYDSHAVQLLSVIVEHAAGETLERFVQRRLFIPLGIHRYHWIADEAGHTFAGRGLELSTRDMIRLGTLMLARGKWQGTRIVDAKFVSNATSAHSEGGPPMTDARYGFLWWVAPRYFFAAGYGEQFICVAPHRRMVVAATSDETPDVKNLRELMERYLFDA